ncbi:MAG: Rieske (2Fe-2S) protein [Chloroflexota bacterium]
MSRKPIEDLIDQQRGWLDPLGKTLVDYVLQLRQAGGDMTAPVLDFLNGVWLGHPLHPTLTDVPVGAWTAAALLDAVDAVAPNSAVRRCADTAVGIGVVAGLGAAPAGVADWQHTTGATRRLGLVHGLLNFTIVALYTVAMLMRRGPTRRAGVSLSLFTYLLAAFSAYIGGELVYRKGIGVDHTAWQTQPKDFVAVLPENELEDNMPKRVDVQGTPVMLLRRHGHIHALAETCTHLGGPLAEGRVVDENIVCPWHGSHFDLNTGDVVMGPATFGEVVYDVRVRDGQVEVRPRA